jgi:hypothetical protein
MIDTNIMIKKDIGGVMKDMASDILETVSSESFI